MNIESSHCYHDEPSFFTEVSSLLKPLSGIFIYSDFRFNSDIPELETLLLNYFDIIKFEDISLNVLNAMSM